MRLNLLLSLTLALGITLLAIQYEDGRRASASAAARQVINACQSFDPDSSEQCGSNNCNPRNVMTNSGFGNGSGIHSLNATTINCSFGEGTEQQPCQNEGVTQFTRFSDPSCCDLDRDGYSSGACGGPDCNDNNSSINPGATEVCMDGIDNDCQDGDACCDDDGDGFGAEWCGGGDCDDANPAINPFALEDCFDGIDGNCNGVEDWQEPICEGQGGCVEGCPWSWVCFNNLCTPGSPILIDTAGNGFRLTDAAGGVNFDLRGDGTAERLSWTAANTDDAWLALDRNGNGRIDDGRELFGNFTPQPSTPGQRHGFLALAEYDKPAAGGNADGVIDAGDAAFASLRLWKDANHNGVSEAGELHALPSQNVASVSLGYRESRRTDRHGNRFLYRSKVEGAGGVRLGRWAWDVFLVGAP
jgi:hypothetical protein